MPNLLFNDDLRKLRTHDCADAIHQDDAGLLEIVVVNHIVDVAKWVQIAKPSEDWDYDHGL